MNWYVLHVLSNKIEEIIINLNQREGIEAFSPKCEYYRRKEKNYAVKPLFNGYIFVKTKMQQDCFNALIQSMYEQKKGLIRQLVNKDTSALTKEETDMFHKLLDSFYTVRVSQAYLQNGKAIIQSGPLIYFEENIIKIDKHNQLAYLDLSFMGRTIKIGLAITSKE